MISKLVSWWKSIWSTVNPPTGQINEPDGTIIPSKIMSDITIKDGGVNPVKVKEATTMIKNDNGDVELK